MKKILLLCFLLACSLGVSYAQTTAVTATVVDSDGTTWANGKWSIAWTPGPSNPNINAYTNNGAPLSNSVAYQSGTLNGSGALSVTIYDSSVTFPTGSGWALSVCSNTSAPCSTYYFATAGGSQDISAALTTNIAAPRFKAVSGTYGYADTEATLSIATGATYWNVTSGASRCYSGSAWGACSSGAANAITALTSDVLANGPGSAAATVVKINGATVPINQPCLGSNGSGQPIPGTCTGGGGGGGGTPVACGGVDDSATINTALAVTGLVTLSGDCRVPTTALVIPSNTTLNAANATVTCAIAPCISNTQFTAQTVNRSFADGVTTSGSQTLTSATAAFTQADVGQSIRCTGALGASIPTLTGFPGIGTTTLSTTIVTVTNGTTATFTDPAGASVNPSTCSILYRDHNIVLTGGRWIFTGPNVGPSTKQHLLFGTIYDLRLENLWFQNGVGGTITNVGSKNIGITDASRFKVLGMTFNSWVTLQDGIDIYGPTRDCTVRDIFGHTGDNSVAVTPFSALGAGQGVVDGCLIENVDTSAGFAAIRIFGNDGGTPVKTNAITVRHYHGAANYVPAQTGGGTGDGVELFYGLGFDNIIIDDVSGLISLCDVNLGGITAGTVTISNLSQSWSTFNSSGSLLCGKQGALTNVGDAISNLIVRGGGLNANNVAKVVDFGTATSATVHSLGKASFCDFKLTGLAGATQGIFTFANTTGSFDFCNDDLNFNTSTASTNGNGIFSFVGPGTVSVSAHGVHADYTNGSLGAGPLFGFAGVGGVYPTFGPIVLNDVTYTSPVALAAQPFLFANASPTGLAPLMSNIVLDHVAGCFSGAVGSPQLSNFLGTNLGTPASCNLFGAAGGNSFNILNVSNVAAATTVFTAYTSVAASELISIKCSIETGAVTGTATASPFFTYGAGQFLTGPVLTMAANAAVSWEAPAIVVTPGTAVRFQINYAAGSGGSYNAKCNLVKY